MNLTLACVRNPVFAWMIMAATVLFGGVAATRIGISQFPDVDFPTISVSATWEGANPQVIENDVVETLEESLVQVEGVRTISSTSRQGRASITLEFDLSRGMDAALQDVQAAVAQAQRRLPKEMDPPVVTKSNPEDQPILMIAVSGPFPRQFLADFVRYRLKERLQGIPGVGEISMFGFLERNVRVWLDARRLEERGLTVEGVITAIRREHVELPAGVLETSGQQINIRVMGEALDLASVRKLVLGKLGDSPTYLEDVALVEDGFEDTTRIARADGAPAQVLGVKKQRGSNAVAVAESVREAVDAVRKTAPAGLSLGIANDSTRFIEESVDEIELELGLSVLLTGLVCWMFLGSLSSTLNVVLAIPMSLFGTIAVIYFLGYTLNTFTLLGLALAVGIVVDDAIMVMENIFRHHENGKGATAAALEGTAEIAFAAMAATLAVVAIFVPVVFISGVIGKFFVQFGVTLSTAVLLSYVEAVTLAPARCAQLLAKARREEEAAGPRLMDRLFSRLERLYSRTLAFALRRPWLVLVAGLLLCTGAAWFLVELPREFVPPHDVGRVVVRLQAAVSADISETNRLTRRAEAIVAARPEVASVLAVVGGGGGPSGGSVSGGRMMITLVPRSQRKLDQARFSTELRKALGGIPGLKATVQDMSMQGITAQRGFPVEFTVRGPDWGELARHSAELMAELAESGAVVDMDTDFRVGMPEIRIVPDPAGAADLGVSSEQLATAINALVGGVRVGRFTTGGRRIDIRLRLLAGQRARPEDLSRLRVRTRGGELVPLSTLVKQEERPELQTIMRTDRERAISVFANVRPGHSQAEALERVEGLGRELPPGYSVTLGGASATFRESTAQLLFALALGIVVAYMILASQFNSFLHPITVLTVLPLSVAGGVAALWAAGMSLNVFSVIGLLLLVGIAKKNSIILVDCANNARSTGLDATAAMQVAGPIRLRPILMTSVATMMAAVPPALGLGPGAETRAPMALGILGGVFVSTLLSLLVVPAFYVVADRCFGRRRPEA